MKTILITGGSGLIGSTLQQKLISKGYTVFILSRQKSDNSNSFYWDIEKNEIEDEAILKADFIIHLAGAGIADKRWTETRKKELIESRVNSANLLLKKVKELNPTLEGFIAASGIGYYGGITSEKIFSEDDNAGTDFISKICQLWEQASLKFQQESIRTVILRTGVVFSKKGGALEKIKQPIQLGVGAALGSGSQYIPWIHIEDLCNLYIEAIENNNFKGVYNAVAPEHCTNKQLTKTIANILNKSIWLPNVPSFLLKLALGKMSVIILEGSRVSSEKAKKIGFKFKFPTVKEALINLKP